MHRYTNDYDTVFLRRRDVPELYLEENIDSLNTRQAEQGKMTGTDVRRLKRQLYQEQKEFAVKTKEGGEKEYNGRSSGSMAWRSSRQEIGGAVVKVVTSKAPSHVSMTN